VKLFFILSIVVSFNTYSKNSLRSALRDVLEQNPTITQKSCMEFFIEKEKVLLNDEIEKLITTSAKSKNALNRQYFHYNSRTDTSHFFERERLLFSPKALGVFAKAQNRFLPSGIGYYVSDEPYSTSDIGSIQTISTIKADARILELNDQTRKAISIIKDEIQKSDPRVLSCSDDFFNYLLAWDNDVYVVHYTKNWYYITKSKVLESQRTQNLDDRHFDRLVKITKQIVEEGSYLHYQSIANDSTQICRYLNHTKLDPLKIENVRRELECI